MNRCHRFLGLGLLLGAIVLPAAFPSRAGAHADLLVQLEDITKQIEKDPRNVDLYLRRGELHRVHLDWDAALADYDRALAIDPASHQVDYFKGRLMADAGWLLSARAYLTRFIASNPRHAEAFSNRARVLARLDLHGASVEDFNAAIRLSPEPGPEMFIERARALAAEADSPDAVAEAIAGLDEGVKRIGPLITLQVLAVELETKRRNYPGALERIDAITERSPRKETWLARRAEVLEQAGRPDEARQAYQAALSAMASLPPVRRNVPAMAQLEKRIRGQLDAINLAHPVTQ